MSSLGELLNEINLLRSNPKGYAEKVLKYKSYFDGNILRIPGTKGGIQTEEGPAAFAEAANFLLSAEPIEEMTPSKGLTGIANDLLSNIQNCEPDELDSIDMNQIIEKYGSFGGNFSRSMQFGGENAEQVIMNLIVNDGDKSRSQRDSLLDDDLKVVGIATGKHKYFGNCSIIVSSTTFDNILSKDDTQNY